MRRGINNRKKKNIMIKEINLKSFKLIIILMFVLIICSILYYTFLNNLFTQKRFEKENINISNLNQNIPFSIKKIILFSSATAETSTVNQSVLNLDLSQYCDIGIYLNKIDDTSISVSSLYIDNIYLSAPKLGIPQLYKKNIPDLGKSTFSENTIITDSFNFNVVSRDEELNHDNQEVYNDLSSPIALGFYNKNIKTGFLSDNSDILYNGLLLKEAAIPLSSINCAISFRLNIITNSGEHYICNVNFDIPFEDDSGFIYNTGYTIKEFNSDELNKFIRVK